MKNACLILKILSVLLITAHSQSSGSQTISAALKYISSGKITPDTSTSYSITVPQTWSPLTFINAYPNGIQNQSPYTILMSLVDLRMIPSSNRIQFYQSTTTTSTSFTVNLYSTFANLIQRISYRYVIIASSYTGNGNFFMSTLTYNYNAYLTNIATPASYTLTSSINTTGTVNAFCFINGIDMNATSANLLSIMVTATIGSGTTAYFSVKSAATATSYSYLSNIKFDFFAYNDGYYNRASFSNFYTETIQSAGGTFSMTHTSTIDYTIVTAIGVNSFTVQGDSFLDFTISLVSTNSISISSANTANSQKSFSVIYVTMMTYYCALATPYFYPIGNICYDYCITRTYTDPITLSCSICPYDCYTCNASSCLTCNSAADFRSFDSTTSRCLPLTGYYQNMTTVCPKCPTNCTKCINQTNCQNCISGMYLTNGICYACPTGCATCISYTQCQTCSAGYTLTSNYMCYNTCPASQYFNTSTFTCNPCLNGCTSCLSSSSCSSCPTTTYISNGLCYNCPTLCSTCLSSYYCYSCQSGSYLRSDQLCYSSCAVRTYADSLLVCLACPYDCYTCNASGFCTSCSTTDHRVLNTSTNRCVPDKGYYDNQTTVCLACNSGCITCLSSTICTSCATEFFFSNGNCNSCPSTCNTCLSSSYCQSCKYPNYINLNTNLCVSTCPSGYFADISQMICSSCSSSCLTCHLNSIYCTSCPSGTYLLGTTCPSCPTACTSCTSSSSCQTCAAGYLKNNAGTCVAQCPQGQYLNPSNSNCASCQSSCLTCTNNSACTSCYPGYYLYNGGCNSCPKGQYLNPNMTCSSSCPVRYYTDTKFNTCQSCPYDCYTCDNTPNCLSCNITTDYRTLNNQTSRCIPIAGYFDNSTTVSLSCSNNCLACTSSTSCSLCNSTYYLNNSACVACPQDCATCITSSFCSTCKNGFYLRPDNLCYSTCLIRTYLYQNLACLNCSYSCYTCNSTAGCLSCSASDFRVLKNNNCVPMDGYYDNQISICAKCPDGCATCQSFTNCNTCKQQYYLSDTSCLPCASNCKICFNGNTCDTCNSQFSLNSGTCKVSQGSQSSGFSMPIGIMAGFAIGALLSIIAFCIYRCKCQKVPKPVLIYKGSEVLGSSKHIIASDDDEIESAENEWHTRSIPISTLQDCSICLFQQTFFRTSCGHHFHLMCIKIWLIKRNNCPNCRQLLNRSKHKIYCRRCHLKYKVLTLDKLKEIAAQKREESETICDECKQVPI